MTDITTRIEQIKALLNAAAEVEGDAGEKPVKVAGVGVPCHLVGSGPIHRLRIALEALKS